MASPSCPICYQPAAGATHACPGCRATYHAQCWPSTGCVVPNCQRPGPARAASAEPERSPLWTVATGAAALGSVLLVLLIAFESGAPAVGGVIAWTFAACVLVALLAGGAACGHDLIAGWAAGRAAGSIALGVLCWAALLGLGLGMRADLVVASTIVTRAAFVAVLFGFVGAAADERKKRALFALCVSVLLLVAVPNFTAARARKGTRGCYAQQKTIVGAVEMYNLDKNTKRTDLGPAFFRALASGGYLTSVPQDPGEGPGSEVNFQLTGTGNGIRCVKHGPIQ